MASKVGIVESINDGKFFAKDSLGNTKELKNGDIIYENDVVFSDGSNSSNSEIRVALEGEDIIVLKNGVQQLFDSSLIASTFGDEEVVFTRKGLEALLQQAGDITNVESDLRWTSFDDYVDITEEETTAGEEEEEILEEGSIGQFASRDGDITDIVSDLRKNSWIRTQNYKEVENSEALEKTSLKPLGENLDTIVSIPRPIAPNPIDTIIPIAPTPVPPTPETPIITPIANLSIDDITMYEQDGFMVFTVTLDIPASGNITVNFATSNGTAEAGKDYTPITGIITIPSGSSTAQIRVPINDDYYYEKSETFNVTLTNPTGNVNIVKPVGVGTILDNPPSNNKPLDPNKPDSETGTYGEEDTVYAIIVGDKTVNEGDKSSYTIKLVDKDGNPVVVDKNTDVTVVYKNISTQDNDTQYKNGDKITVTIPKGSSEVKFEVQTKDDFYADNGENFNLSIEKVDTNEFENVVIGDKNGKNKDVTTEILDNTTTNPNNPSTNEKEQEQVVLKIVAADKDGNPIKGTDGNYLTQNEVPEGSDVYYVVLAFKPDTTTFNDSTKLPIQEGKVEVETSNKTASGVNSQTKDDGTEDYISKKEIVELGKPISVKTLDDWKSDNNEQFEIKIIDKTYQHPSTPVYENVKTDTNPVTTTIKDDTDITPNNPNDNKIETNQEQVILKIVACDSTGNPIIVNGKYTFANEVAEGSNAKYMVLAFHPNTTEFKTTDKLDVQDGKVTIKTADGTAVTTGSTDFATKDYEAQTNKTVTLGQSFEVKTLDDYIADNNENYTVLINDKSYAHPATPIYENVVTDKDPVTTTILDNSNPKDPTNPHNPNDPANHNQESDKEIVLIKLFAADKDGKVLKDINGNYLLANKAEEGTKAKYIAFAFEKDTTTFNNNTKLANQTGKVDIIFTDGTAKGYASASTDGTKDFNNTSKSQIDIGTAFSTEVFKDSTDEGDENYTVTIKDGSYTGNYESVEIDTRPVTTTIFDKMIFVKIVAITPEINEGGNLKYKVVLVNSSGDEVKVPAGKNLVVNLAYTGNTSKPADDTTDYTPVITVKIDGGNSSKEFEVETKDDYYAEGDEGLKITITSTDNNTSNAFNKNVNLHTEANGAPSDAIEVTGTIKDNPSKINESDTSTTEDDPTNGSYGQDDTVYAIITGTQTIKEGDISTDYTVKLVDKNRNTVTPTKDTQVTIKFEGTSSNQASLDDIKKFLDSSNNDISIDAQNNIKVTIPANSSEVKFKVETKDDFYADNNEQFKLTITDVDKTGEFENVKFDTYPNTIAGASNNVITTITDNTTLTPNEDSTVETNGMEKVILKIIACDSNGIPIKDGSGNYVTINDVAEGSNAKYMVLAFKPNTTIFNDTSKLDIQGGKVTIKTTDDTAKGVTTQTKIDGTQDYKSETTKSVDVGVAFDIKTFDDYLKDGGETFKVSINDKSYTHPTSGAIYENVKTDTNPVTTTITDNPAKVKQPDNGTGNDDQTNGSYGKEDTVYVKIIDNATVVEGGDLVHNIQLVDKDGNAVVIPDGETITITLQYSSTNNVVTSGDFKDDSNFPTTGNTVSVTIDKNTPKDANGIYKLPITNKTKDDFKFEGDEVYTLTITDVAQNSSTFENIAIGNPNDTGGKSVTGTIKDGVTIVDSNGNKINPENAIVDEDRFDVTNQNSEISNKDLNTSKPNGTLDHQGQYLNIIKPNTDNNYSLIFDGNPTVYKGDKDSGIAFDYGDSRGTSLQSGGVVIQYVVNENTITGYKGSGRAETDKVFDIVLNKDSSILSGSTTKDNYTYTQYKNIDHPVTGIVRTNSGIDDNITFEFGFKIKDQGQTSETVKFKVTVNDSLPKATNWEETVNEDGSVKIVISPENFKGGEIKIKVNGDSDYTTLSNGQTKNVTDPNDSTKVIGILNNNGDGTVTFTPSPDYSNYNVNPWFEYSVSDFDGDTAAARVSINVKPVADAPTIYVKDISTTEDNGNTKEGTNKVDLELKVPYLSKDSDKTYSGEDGYIAKQNSNTTVTTPILTPSGDKNNGKTGDNPERNGEITLTFTNGQSLVLKNADGTTIAGTGAKIFIGNETSVSSTINSNNQEIKVVIVTASGGTDIDYNYHHKDVTSSNPSGDNVLYLTKSEYESLKIQHAEDNDTDIKITIKVTSYEVDDSGIPLDKTTYGNQVESTTTADMIVKIQPMTDDIKLEFNDTNVKYFEKKTDGTFVEKTIIGSKTRSDKDTNIDNVEDTFTFTNKISEGSGEINLNSILSNTSGALNGTGGTKGDLDGSEKRTYTITGIPEGTIVKIGSTEAVAGKDEKATLTFKDAENKELDPNFTMEFPKTFGGGVKATITLSVQDKGVDSTDTAGVIKTQTVYLNLDVEPVATTPDLNTFQVSQAIGYEDAGRTNGNSATPNDAINENGTGGIPLNIKVTSEDKSEIANIKITNIPNGAKLYYGGTEVTADGSSEYIINNFDNAKSLVYIPAHNDDFDPTLKVSVQFEDSGDTTHYVDGTTAVPTHKPTEWSGTKDISVIVKNKADAPVGTGIAGTKVGENEYTLTTNATEDTSLNLKSIYTDSTKLASSDSSEELTVRIKLPAGFNIDNGSPYFIDNGEYVVKVSDIQNDKVNIKFPHNFSGDTSFDLTYVTTEKAGENDSKTWHTDKINVFVEPKADDVTIASGSTIYEDGQDKDGNVLNTKIDLKPTLTDTGTTNGTETVEAVYISTDTIDSMIIKGYKLYIDGTELNTTSHVSKTVILEDKTTATKNYYVVNKDLLDKITVKNTVDHKINGDFTLNVAYKVTDTNSVVSDTKIYEHTHTVTVKAVTDQPTLGLGTITTTDSSKTTITGTTVTVESDANADFTIPVTTTSSDNDSSEKVQEIIISGVPKGVEVVGATYYGYSGSVHNGIWVIRGTNLTDKDLDNDGASQNIKFVVNPGADFKDRPIKITTYTKDEATDGTKVESASQTINIVKNYTPSGTTGNPPLFNLGTKPTTIYEDNDDKNASTTDDVYNLGKSITVTAAVGYPDNGHYAITITDFPAGTTLTGYDYSYIGEGGKTYYVVTGTGSASDIMTKLSNVIVTPPADMNTGGDKNGQMTFSATISTWDNGTYKKGTSIGQGDDASNTDYVSSYTNHITPVTDEMTIAINVTDTNEDATTSLTITLSNQNDGSKTTLIGNSITIKIDETWKDLATGGVGTKGTLTDSSGKYNIVDNGDGTYTITPKNVADNFKVDTPITGLVYTPAINRDGEVKFDVTVKNKEGNSVELTSPGQAIINVKPVIDMKPEVTVVTATGTEDTAVTVGSTTLANAVKLNVTPKTGETFDSSEKFTNIVLDEVPNGFTVWYKDSGNNLVMATNIGKSGTGTFDLTPNISGDGETHRNKWLIPVAASGVMPEIYINAPENWAGDFDFKAQFTLKEQNLTTTEKIVVDVTGKIIPVADGVTIDPTLTFGKAFEWVDLKLNANMKDVDGSETMSLELSGLGANAQFKISGTDTLVSAVYNGGKWTLSGIKYDEINKIQFTNDKDVNSVDVKAWTEEISKDTNGNIISVDSTKDKTGGDFDKQTGSFNLDIKDVGGILELDKGINLDFSKLETTSLKGINSIDLSKAGENKLENLKLSDVLNMTNNKGELIIKGDSDDKVSLKNEAGKTWSKGGTETIDSKTFDIYSNSGDTSVKVKVEQAITDGITS